MKYKSLIFICLIICLFAIAGVTAAEVDDTSMAMADTGQLDVSQSEMIIHDGDNLEKCEENDQQLAQTDNVEMSAADGESVPALEENANASSDAASDLGILASGEDYAESGEMNESTLAFEVIALNVTVEENTMFAVNVADDFDGNVSITVDDNMVYDGKVKTLIKGAKLLAGNKTATVVFYGDGRYDNMTLNDVTFTVSKVTPSMDVSIDDSNYPNSAYAVIVIGNDAEGIARVSVDGRSFSQNVSGGRATVELKGLSAGYKVVKVDFISGDDYNNDATAYDKFIVFPNNSLVSISSEHSYHVGDEIVLEVKTTNSTGDVHIYLNGEYYKQLGYNYERVHPIDFSDLGEGSYVISVYLDGDENYTAYNTFTSIYVVKKDLKIEVADIDEALLVGSSVTLTANLNQTISGDVIFTINGENYTVHISNGNFATYEYTPLDNSTLNVVATFMGCDEYNSNASDSRSFNVNRIPADISVWLNSTKVGQNAIAQISMSPSITTTVKLRIGTKTYDVAIVDGFGSFNVSGLAYGSYDVYVEFAGDVKYGSALNGTVLNVDKIDGYGIDVGVCNISYGENETVMVVLPSDISPSQLTIKVDENIINPDSVENGVAIVVVSRLSVGTHEVSVNYAGDDKYEAKDSNSNAFIVYPSDAYTIYLAVENRTYGEDTTFEVTINNDVTKNITLSIDGVEYSIKPNDLGIATLTLNNLTGGLHALTVTYPGDENYPRGSKSTVFIIPRAESSIGVDFTTPLLIGDAAIINVTMGQAINGTAILTVGDDSYNVAIVDGVGTYAVRNLANGIFDVKAAFEGNENYSASASGIMQLEVNKIETRLFAIDVTTTYNADKKLVVTLKDSEGNLLSDLKVNILLNGKNTQLTTDKNGQVMLTTNNLVPKASYVATIKFAGNAKYADSSKTVKVTVKKDNAKLVASGKSFAVKATKKIAATLKDSKNRAIKNKYVTFKVNGVSYKVKTNSNGVATATVKIAKKGSFSATVSFAGDNCYNKCSKTIKLTVK